MVLLNTKPKPRAIFIGFDQDELESNTSLLNLFPHYVLLSAPYELSTIRQSEYDVALTLGCDITGLEKHLFVVSLGGENLGESRIGNVIHRLVEKNGVSVAKEFIIDDDIGKEVAALVKETLYPLYASENRHNVLASTMFSAGYRVTSHAWMPLISDGDHKVLSGFVVVNEELKNEHWRLHEGLTMSQLEKWMVKLIERWSLIAPEKFLKESDWKQDPSWQSQKEIIMQGKIDALRAEMDKYVFEKNKEIEEKQNELSQATIEADGDNRALLTAKGDELKATVKLTLESFGFGVIDVDEIKTKQQEKTELLEDLRVVFPKDGEARWLALSEVRGYARGGAKTSDLQRIGRFGNRYSKENGKEPNSLWYIVNHDISKAPNKRALALVDSKDDVEVFSIDNGLVIDTVTLFKIRKAVEAGELSSSDARKLLKNSTGYLVYPIP